MPWPKAAAAGRQARNARRKRENPAYRGYWEAMALRALEKVNGLTLMEMYSPERLDSGSIVYFTARVDIIGIGQGFVQNNSRTLATQNKQAHCAKYGIPLLLMQRPHRMSIAELRIYIERWAAQLRYQQRKSQ